MNEKCQQYLKLLDDLQLLMQQKANLNIPIEEAIIVVETEQKIRELLTEIQYFEQELLVH